MVGNSRKSDHNDNKYVKCITFFLLKSTVHCLSPCLLTSSHLLLCLNWCIAIFLGMLPPRAVNQRNSRKPSAGLRTGVRVCVCKIQTKTLLRIDIAHATFRPTSTFILFHFIFIFGRRGATEAALKAILTMFTCTLTFHYSSDCPSLKHYLIKTWDMLVLARF